ncbi:heavy-metal-associated domain-containing protein, partial [Streptomyces sp. SID7499]|nr:heavy-metal-associated domain-containing protein [Streptomyces sp. SID7499]
GMTCASCAARVEKKLNRMDGVTATVNYATEKARVTFGEGLKLGDLVATVEKTGYTARPVAQPERKPPAGGGAAAPPAAPDTYTYADGARRTDTATGPGTDPAAVGTAPGPAPAFDPGDAVRDAEAEQEASIGALRQRLVVSAVLAVPVVLLAMVPALQFDYWQ